VRDEGDDPVADAADHAMSRALLLAVALAACGGAPAEPAEPAAPIVDTSTGSAAPVVEDPAPQPQSAPKQPSPAWADEMATNPDRNVKAEPAEAERLAAQMRPLIDEFSKCAMNALTPATP
jgi:hypothetical protein